MKKIVFALIGLAFFQTSISSQTLPQSEKGWQRTLLKKTGSFDLPPTLAILKGKYRIFVDELTGNKGYDTSNFTADAVKKDQHAHFEFDTSISTPGDNKKLDFTTSERDIDDLNAMSRKQYAAMKDVKLIEWYRVKFEKHSGMSCYHYGFKRQQPGKPYEMVHIYCFQNNDRMHQLTLSYYLSEANFWKADFAKILETISLIEH